MRVDCRTMQTNYVHTYIFLFFFYQHLTSNCTKTKDTPAKCVNCDKAHPANYRGCEVAQKLQQIRENLNKDTKIINQKSFPVSRTRTGTSYAETLRSNAPTTNILSSPILMEAINPIKDLLEKINKRLDKLENHIKL